MIAIYAVTGEVAARGELLAVLPRAPRCAVCGHPADPAAEVPWCNRFRCTCSGQRSCRGYVCSLECCAGSCTYAPGAWEAWHASNAPVIAEAEIRSPGGLVFVFEDVEHFRCEVENPAG